MTPLSTLPNLSAFPAVTFAATANITGQDRTPPGRPGVPFMLAHDYIGGPATGWVPRFPAKARREVRERRPDGAGGRGHIGRGVRVGHGQPDPLL